jgi:hypothetical protein
MGTPDAQTTSLAEREQAQRLTQAVLSTAIALTAAAPTPTPTQTPTPTVTAIPTQTFTPSPTATATPTPTPAFVQPGVYTFNTCINHDVSARNWRTGEIYPGKAVFCIVSIQVNQDRTMSLVTSWTITWEGNWGGKQPEEGSRKMYLTDEAGQRYDAVAWGGDNRRTVSMGNWVSTAGWFTFPAAPDGIYAFTFHDDDQKITVGPLTLTGPAQPLPETTLSGYPFQFDLTSMPLWSSARTADGRLILTHRVYGNTLEEMPAGEIIGKFDTITLLQGKVLLWEQVIQVASHRFDAANFQVLRHPAGITRETGMLFLLQPPAYVKERWGNLFEDVYDLMLGLAAAP